MLELIDLMELEVIVVLTMQQEQANYLLEGDYDKETFKLDDFSFVFHTVDRCRELLKDAGIRICHEVASDGASELLQDMVKKWTMPAISSTCATTSIFARSRNVWE